MHKWRGIVCVTLRPLANSTFFVIPKCAQTCSTICAGIILFFLSILPNPCKRLVIKFGFVLENTHRFVIAVAALFLAVAKLIALSPCFRILPLAAGAVRAIMVKPSRFSLRLFAGCTTPYVRFIKISFHCCRTFQIRFGFLFLGPAFGRFLALGIYCTHCCRT